MRRIIGALAIAAFVGPGAVALTTGAASAEPIRSVEFTGTSVFDFATPECSFAHQVFDATLATHRGDSLHIDGCTEVLTSPFTFTGTFVLDSPGRHDITGTVTGFVGGGEPGPCDVGFGASLDFELTPTSGTGRPPPPLQLHGTWCSPMAPRVPGPISGTLTGALPPGRA